MNELNAALYSRLTGTAALTALLYSSTSVYPEMAPQNVHFPLVIFGLQGGGDENKSPHRSKSLLYLIKAVTNGGIKAAATIDAQIDAALHFKPLTVVGWTNTWIARETDVQIVEDIPGGAQYFHRGALYRVRLAQ